MAEGLSDRLRRRGASYGWAHLLVLLIAALVCCGVPAAAAGFVWSLTRRR